MLKTIEAILAMLKEQEAALVEESGNRFKRDEDTIAAIKADATGFHTQVEAMLNNIRLAIRKLEGEEVANG